MDKNKKYEETDTEQKILKAAAIVFERDGFAGARMQAIADESGMNKALLHYYFRSKELLFKRIFFAKLQTFFQDMVSLLDTEVDFFLRIDMFIDNYMRMLLANPDLPVMLFTTVHQNPEFLNHLDGSFGFKMREMFQKEMDEGRIIKINPLHIITSIVGLSVMPFLARPLASHVFKIPAPEYQKLLEERGAFVKHAIRAMLIPN